MGRKTEAENRSVGEPEKEHTDGATRGGKDASKVLRLEVEFEG